jgi:hypothetical protein
MMISDVILEANNEHEIFFLLTAYVESLRYCDKLGTLPQGLTRLPLSGAGDVQSKFIGIRAVLNDEVEDCGTRTYAILREAVDVFGAAVDRLDRLAEAGAMPYPPSLVPTPQGA